MSRSWELFLRDMLEAAEKVIRYTDERQVGRSLKDLLLAMPAEGTDEDFAREPDHGGELFRSSTVSSLPR